MRPPWFEAIDRLHRAILARQGATPYGPADGPFLTIAMVGEAGEVANEMKKWMRGDYTHEQAVEKLKGEMADVRICLELLARHLEIDLDVEVERKTEELFQRWRNRGLAL